MQDAFVRVLERWGRIDNSAGYLYRSAFNATSSRYRRLKLAARRALTSGEPEDPFAAADLRDEIVRALRGASGAPTRRARAPRPPRPSFLACTTCLPAACTSTRFGC